MLVTMFLGCGPQHVIQDAQRNVVRIIRELNHSNVWCVPTHGRGLYTLRVMVDSSLVEEVIYHAREALGDYADCANE